jgi:acetyltransferase-like isoleucine patch superfamily enzyme
MPGEDRKMEGREAAWFAGLAVRLYGMTTSRAVRSIVRRLVLRLEGGPVYSRTIREIYRRYHGVDVGLYTIGPCNVPPGNLAPGTTVGRYSSIYYTVRTFTSDRQAGTGHAARAPGGGESPEPASGRLVIGHDVWMGHNVIVMPSAGEIGDGAVIGAGSVVQARVPPYAVVTGNPARVVRYRFSEGVIRQLRESQWWLQSIDELQGDMEKFQKPLEGG